MNLSKKSEIFWFNQAKKLSWNFFPKKIFTKKNNYYSWFPDGKINLYQNLIEVHLVKNSKKKALYILDKNNNVKSYSYNDLDILVNNFLFFLKTKSKNRKIKRIMIHASSSLESAISMLACCKRGIFFSVIFEDLPEFAIEKRLDIFAPDIFITRSKKIYFNFLKKNKYSKIIFLNFNQSKENVGSSKKMKSKTLSSSNSFFCLFTSGSTGVPKGIIHSYGGYSVYLKYTCKNQFGMEPDSLVLTASDAGWINGHSYALFGPLFFGATTILCENPMLLLNNSNLKKVLNLGTTIFYSSVTIIRLMKASINNYNFKNNIIKSLGSMGEPLAPTVAKWYSRKFIKSSSAVVNTYFQTETGGIIASPKFSDTNLKSPHGSVGQLCTNHIKIKKLNSNKKKEFVITTPWPGCMKDVINGKKEWNKYWDKNNNFRMFDLATEYKNSIYIHGRIDDVINIRGHRIGSGEIESVLLKNQSITECCAIAGDDELEGNIFYLFIVTKNNIDKKIINLEIKKNFGSYAIPRKIFNVPELPKTRSGKILRRLLRSMVEKKSIKKEYGDLSTILNIEVVPIIKDIINKNE
jgi:acetyl-CoA synthetase